MIKFGLSLPLSYDIKQLINLTTQAEHVGFDYAFMPDHVVSLDGKQPLNVWSVLNILATHTHSIGLGSMVANIYRQHPSTLYQQIYTLRQSIQLHSIVQRKLMIGLGAGMKFDCKPFGILQTHPIGRLTKICSELEKLDVDIVIGAVGPKMKSFAIGTNGWVSRHALSPEEFGEEHFEVKLHETDKKMPLDFIYIADVPVSHLDEPWLWKSLAYRYLLQTKYRDDTFNKLTQDRIEADSSKVPRSTLEGFSAIGNTEDIIKKLESYVSYGANMFSIRYYGEDLEKFGDVIDYFKDK